MFRYVALIWNENDPDVCRAARALQLPLIDDAAVWSCGLARDGLSVFHTVSPGRYPDVLALPENEGVILGAIHRSQPQESTDDAGTSIRLDAADAEQIRASAGQSMIRDYWGSYVLIQADPQRCGVRVLRGPMSDLPCFHLQYHGVHLFFSLLEDCINLGAGPFSANWDYLRAMVVFCDPRTTETALNEVGSVDVGECVTVDGNRLTRKWYWHPGHIASSDSITRVSEAVTRLRSTTRRCVHALAARHDAIALLLSGGVDSSIVAMCLRNAPTRPRVSCLNYYFSSIVGDERKYARAVASRCGFDLVEQPHDDSGDLGVLRHVGKTPCPYLYFSGYNTYRNQMEFATARGITAIFSGSMGDCVFGRGETLSAAAEYVQRHGIRPQLFRIAYDIALRQRLSMWTVLRFALHAGLLQRPRGPWSHYLQEKSRYSFSSYLRDRMLTTEAISQYESELERFIHPWLRHAEALPIGKLGMIAILTMEMPFDNPFIGADDTPVIRPLTSQPLVECSLCMESFLNVVDGWDRAIARLAFADELPEVVLRRNTKGSPSQTNRQIIDKNAAFIREFLLDGILVKERILDPKKIEAALPITPSKAPASTISLTEHLYTEAWVRHWIPGNRQYAA